MCDFILELETLFGKDVAKAYKEAIGYSKVFNLKADAVHQFHDLSEEDQRIRLFTRYDGNSIPTTIEDLQTDVTPIQLITAVPEDVKRVFRRTKELCVF